MNKPNDDRSFVFREGDAVEKTTGDYVFRGIVMATFRKRSGAPRYVVENADGLVHIFNHTQLKLIGSRP